MAQQYFAVRITPTYMGNTEKHVNSSRQARITPTYMGNTGQGVAWSQVTKDHPHIHGEYKSEHRKSTRRAGSPPHTWGIQNGFEKYGEKYRITPTYMGNTTVSLRALQSTKDHPHIHGEYATKKLLTCRSLGSPPHTWGIRITNRDVAELTRITPTYMGNTIIMIKATQGTGDHPHIHGEYVTR